MGAKKYDEQGFLDEMSALFKVSCVKEPSLLGVEFEHFLIDKESMRSYGYDEENGQKDILEALAKDLDWQVMLKEGQALLGLKKNGHTITLEPGGQIEVSLGAFTSLEEIENAYLEVLNDIKSKMLPSQRLVSLGYHPKSKIDDLPLLPKERYHFMYTYFNDRGNYCHNMMKGTASTQVSIDYKDEADYRKKNRVAQFLAPILASLFDSTPIFEGDIYKGNNCRVDIWNHTDINRSKYIKGSFDPEFGFRNYANYLLNLPPVILKSDGAYYFTKGEPLYSLLSQFPLKFKDDFEHIQSMVFPDVRLKGFLEIRMADAMPYPYNLSVPMIIKTIFYNANLLEKYDILAREAGEAWIEKANQAVLKTVNPMVEKYDFKVLKEMIFNDAITVLSPSECRPIMMLRSIVQEHDSLKNWLLSLYRKDPQEFVKIISV